jgi:hypothetical protein
MKRYIVRLTPAPVEIEVGASSTLEAQAVAIRMYEHDPLSGDGDSFNDITVTEIKGGRDA